MKQVKQFQLARLCNFHPNYPPTHPSTHFPPSCFPSNACSPPTSPPTHFLLHMCSPLHSTSSLPYTSTSSQSPHLLTFTPAPPHFYLQYPSPHTPASSPPHAQLPPCLIRLPARRDALPYTRLCATGTLRLPAHHVPRMSPTASGISISHHSWLFIT